MSSQVSRSVFPVSSSGSSSVAVRAPVHLNLVSAAIVSFLEWSERRRQRVDLAQLSDAMLKDIGVSRADAEKEIAKPFWKA